MISDQQLEELEKSLQKDSDWVLQRLTLIPKLQKYGLVKMAGAKALEMIVAKDIDISVIVDQVRTEDWQKLVKELMTTPYVRNISAIDYYNYDKQNKYDPTNGQKYSLYISINNIVGPEGDIYDTWECQIHLIEPKIFDETKIIGVTSKLTPEKRLTILQLKYWANLVNKKLKASTDNNFKIYSPSIYEAVLDKNVTSVDDFVTLYKQSVPEKFAQVFDSIIRQDGKELSFYVK